MIFAYLGYLSYITGQSVENVVSEGKQSHRAFLKENMGVLRSGFGLRCVSVRGHHASGRTSMVHSLLLDAHPTRPRLRGNRSTTAQLTANGETPSRCALVRQRRNHRCGDHRSNTRLASVQLVSHTSRVPEYVWTRFTSVH